MTNIIICGFHASGKTTVGESLALLQNKKFVDTDVWIQKYYQSKNSCRCNCREIYLKHGENYFRNLEQKAVLSLRNIENSIISLGGGTLAIESNRKIIRELGYIVHLNTNNAIIQERMHINGTPLFLLNNNFDSIFSERNTVFQEIANLSISISNETSYLIAQKINQHFRGATNGK